MNFFGYFFGYTSDVYISDTSKAVICGSAICGSVILLSIVYFSTGDKKAPLNEIGIDKLIKEKYAIRTQTDHSSLLNFKLFNFEINNDNTHIGSEDKLLNIFHPHFRALLSPEDYMIQELDGFLHYLLFDFKALVNCHIPLFIFFSLTCISIINYSVILFILDKRNPSILGLDRSKLQKKKLIKKRYLNPKIIKRGVEISNMQAVNEQSVYSLLTNLQLANANSGD